MALRAKLETDTLLKIVLGLLAVLLALEVAERLVGFIFGLLRPVVVLVLVILVVLYLLDRI